MVEGPGLATRQSETASNNVVNDDEKMIKRLDERFLAFGFLEPPKIQQMEALAEVQQHEQTLGFRLDEQR